MTFFKNNHLECIFKKSMDLEMMWCFIPLLLIYLTPLKASKFDDCPMFKSEKNINSKFTSLPDTKFKCYKLYNEVHCEYHNIYFDGRSFYSKTEKYSDIPRVMINPLNFTDYWKPKNYIESDIKAVSIHVRNKLSFIIEIPYADNMGHNMLDCIYPLYLKLQLLNLSLNSDFDIYCNQRIYPKLPIPIRRSFSARHKSIFTKFSKGDFYDMDPYGGYSRKYNELVLVKHLYAGCGKFGMKYLNQDYHLVGSKKYNLLQKFRDRFYDTYEVNTSVPRDLIMIVHNKRYERNKNEFLNLIRLLKNRYHGFSIEYVSFADYSFSDQLKLMARTIFYVSGPGTALTNHIFLQDKSFLYNIGDLLESRDDRYMEEYLAESMPLIQPFYYFENANATKINFTLLESDINFIIKNHFIPNNFTRNATEHGSGLSFIGKKFIHYCGMFHDFCDSYIFYMFSHRLHGECCASICIWEENILLNKCDHRHAKCPYPYKIPFKCDENYNCKIT